MHTALMATERGLLTRDWYEYVEYAALSSVEPIYG